MMSRYFRLSAELCGAIAKRLPHAKYQLSVPGSFFNQFVRYIYIASVYIYIYIYICNELIEGTTRHRKLILACESILAMTPLSSDLTIMSTHHGIITSLSLFL